jgi:hypothetical protein
LTKTEEKQILKILDDLAVESGVLSSQREKHVRDKGYYLDRLWYIVIESEKIPLVAFEIEKGIPTNERIRKDILNIVLSKAPKGYLITPHKRILESVGKGRGWETWYGNCFPKAFKNYREPFVSWCDIQVLDADMLVSSRSLRKSIVS